MAKVTKAGGPSGWPNQAEQAGTDSSASTEQPEQSSSKSEQQNQPPAPMTEPHSEPAQEDSSGAPSTDGDQTDDVAGVVRETDEGVGAYDTWRKDDLLAQADVRGLPYNSRTTNAELVDMLREDDATDPTL
jgi:hypothetical protein